VKEIFKDKALDQLCFRGSQNRALKLWDFDGFPQIGLTMIPAPPISNDNEINSLNIPTYSDKAFPNVPVPAIVGDQTLFPRRGCDGRVWIR